MAEFNGSAIPDFMRPVVTDEPPASSRVVAEHAVLALNESMTSLYDTSLATFKQNMRNRVPIIVALFTGAGGQMILLSARRAPDGGYGATTDIDACAWPSKPSDTHCGHD